MFSCPICGRGGFRKAEFVEDHAAMKHREVLPKIPNGNIDFTGFEPVKED